MQKTRLGISVNLLAALIYFAALVSGDFVVLIVLTGYVLLMESDLWLRRAAVKATVLYVGIGLLISAVYLIPNFVNWLDTLLKVFEQSISYNKLNDIIAVIVSGLSFIRKVLMIGLGLKMLKHTDMAVAKVDKIVDDHIIK